MKKNDEITKLKNENARLRNALERIVWEHENCPPAARQMHHVAKTALNHKGE